MFSPDKQVLVNYHLQQFRQLSIKWYYDGMLMFTSENESKFDIPSILFQAGPGRISLAAVQTRGYKMIL